MSVVTQIGEKERASGISLLDPEKTIFPTDDRSVAQLTDRTVPYA
jgi:hypothetical protein